MYVWTAFRKMCVPLNTNPQRCSPKAWFQGEEGLGNTLYHALQPPLEIYNTHIKDSEKSLVYNNPI